MAKAKTTKPEATPAPRREGTYPYNALQQSLKIGDAVSQVGGREAPKSLIAQTLGMSDSSSSFYQLISSAKAYGIVEGTRDMSLTEAGSDYFRPTSETSRRLAELRFFASPDAFKFLIERFDGKVVAGPPLLANLLVRYNQVPESWSARVAAFFVGTADDLGLRDSQGFLRYDATLHGARREPLSGNGTEGSAARLPRRVPDGTDAPSADAASHDYPRAQIAVPSPAAQSNVWVYSEAGGAVRLETPDPFPFALWERLKRYVDVLEPPRGSDREQ